MAAEDIRIELNHPNDYSGKYSPPRSGALEPWQDRDCRLGRRHQKEIEAERDAPT